MFAAKRPACLVWDKPIISSCDYEIQDDGKGCWFVNDSRLIDSIQSTLNHIVPASTSLSRWNTIPIDITQQLSECLWSVHRPEQRSCVLVLLKFSQSEGESKVPGRFAPGGSRDEETTSYQYINALIDQHQKVFVLPNWRAQESLYPLVAMGRLDITTDGNLLHLYDIEVCNGDACGSFGYVDRLTILRDVVSRLFCHAARPEWSDLIQVQVQHTYEWSQLDTLISQQPRLGYVLSATSRSARTVYNETITTWHHMEMPVRSRRSYKTILDVWKREQQMAWQEIRKSPTDEVQRCILSLAQQPLPRDSCQDPKRSYAFGKDSSGICSLFGTEKTMYLDKLMTHSNWTLTKMSTQDMTHFLTHPEQLTWDTPSERNNDACHPTTSCGGPIIPFVQRIQSMLEGKTNKVVSKSGRKNTMSARKYSRKLSGSVKTKAVGRKRAPSRRKGDDDDEEEDAISDEEEEEEDNDNEEDDDEEDDEEEEEEEEEEDDDADGVETEEIEHDEEIKTLLMNIEEEEDQEEDRCKEDEEGEPDDDDEDDEENEEEEEEVES